MFNTNFDEKEEDTTNKENEDEEEKSPMKKLNKKFKDFKTQLFSLKKVDQN